VIFRLDYGGLENGLVNLINGLSTDQFKHVIICIDDFTDFGSRIRRDDVQLVAIRKKAGTDLPALMRLYRVFRDLRPDIVHTRNLAALDALVPAFVAGVRVRIHGEHGWDVNDLNGDNRKLQLLRKLHSPLVNCYIALSKDQEFYLVNKIGIDGSRVEQIYNGVDTQAFGPSIARNLDQLQIGKEFDANSILIGTVGRMQAVKSPLTVAKAFIQLLERAPDLAATARLVMIGDGPLRADVISLIEEAGFGDVAWVPGLRNDVPEIMRNLDVYVQPSLAEGISNTVLEAMASALPVIATNVGGNAELVEDDVTGTLVPAGDSHAMSVTIEKYVRDQQLRKAQGASGRLRTEEFFGMEMMLKSYSEIYTRCADLFNTNRARN
jgi:sugar transferase (PEP-CTERM/EpsH1 system associated)